MIRHGPGRAVVDIAIKTFFTSSSFSLSSSSSSSSLMLSSRRSFSSSASASSTASKLTTTKTKTMSNTTAAAADRRLAGRRRFYKHVGIAPIAPPSSSSSSSTLSLGKTTTTTTDEMVDSPISAGVDGTQSASGVHTSLTNADLWVVMMNPRRNRHHCHHRLHDGDSSDESTTTTLEADEEESLAWYTVTLDGKTLRTPLGLPLSIPSLQLALAIASEWDAQKTHLRPAQMPLMTLCCTSIDQVANNPTSHQDDILRYLANDTTCYYANHATNSKERPLYKRQCASWDGLHSHVITTVLGINNHGDIQPACAMGEGEAISLSRRSSATTTTTSSSSSSDSSSSTTPNNYSGLPHPPILIKHAQQWVQSLDAWTLTALYSACVESKSFFVGAALIHTAMKNNNQQTPMNNSNTTTTTTTTTNDNVDRDGAWAVNAARVEEEFNIECWGLVEGGHDYDRLNCSVQMYAASFMVQTVSNC